MDEDPDFQNRLSVKELGSMVNECYGNLSTARAFVAI
jgi:hypothetical protein